MLRAAQPASSVDLAGSLNESSMASLTRTHLISHGSQPHVGCLLTDGRFRIHHTLCRPLPRPHLPSHGSQCSVSCLHSTLMGKLLLSNVTPDSEQRPQATPLGQQGAVCRLSLALLDLAFPRGLRLSNLILHTFASSYLPMLRAAPPPCK